MIVIIYVFLWLACTSTLCLFSFWIGRCARRVPIIDDNLPWTMEPLTKPPAVSQSARRCTIRPGASRLVGLVAANRRLISHIYVAPVPDVRFKE